MDTGKSEQTYLTAAESLLEEATKFAIALMTTIQWSPMRIAIVFASIKS
jgi:hypothetical protein